MVAKPLLLLGAALGGFCDLPESLEHVSKGSLAAVPLGARFAVLTRKRPFIRKHGSLLPCEKASFSLLKKTSAFLEKTERVRVSQVLKEPTSEGSPAPATAFVAALSVGCSGGLEWTRIPRCSKLPRECVFELCRVSSCNAVRTQRGEGSSSSGSGRSGTFGGEALRLRSSCCGERSWALTACLDVGATLLLCEETPLFPGSKLFLPRGARAKVARAPPPREDDESCSQVLALSSEDCAMMMTPRVESSVVARWERHSFDARDVALASLTGPDTSIATLGAALLAALVSTQAATCCDDDDDKACDPLCAAACAALCERARPAALAADSDSAYAPLAALSMGLRSRSDALRSHIAQQLARTQFRDCAQTKRLAHAAQQSGPRSTRAWASLLCGLCCDLRFHLGGSYRGAPIATLQPSSQPRAREEAVVRAILDSLTHAAFNALRRASNAQNQRETLGEDEDDDTAHALGTF